ncbi:DgyrCDS2146 [Dimorphilus gyrociliatus]|uniref:Heparan-sulfate 6-O-sulfotransferase n=1 Tax=Dimorphilus gyrociliatus TaxID=2664684 RepID=A0A7I8V9L7_9ANNE|nr:DgyrCDS2146 [Dimorphilus gyrociliatus]
MLLREFYRADDKKKVQRIFIGNALSLLFIWGIFYSRRRCFGSCLSGTLTDSKLDKYNLLENEEYVLVFLHIQKTGGSYFGRQLVKSLLMRKPCKCVPGRKRCSCLHKGNNWIFSRFSTGWACGLHADWTELHECIDKKMNRIERKRRKRRPLHPNIRYLYITNIREPVKRYLSEWKHTQRGATWKEATLSCQGKKYRNLIPKCYKGQNWKRASLKEFCSCPYNLANNRQTRMLSNLSLIECYNSSLPVNVQEEIMYNSAKKNLQELAFFALTEYLVESQFLFERTFKTKFLINFVTSNETKADTIELSKGELRLVRLVNKLDVKLYKFAKKLFFKRYNAAKKDYFDEMGFEYQSEKDIINNTALEDILETATDEDIKNIKKNGLSLLKSTNKILKISNKTKITLRALSKKSSLK